MSDKDILQKILLSVTKSSYSSFYREKYKKAGVKLVLKTLEDFRRVPFLTREEIAASDPFDRLYVSPKDIAYVTVSSGTTGKKEPLVLPMTKWHDNALVHLFKLLKKLNVTRVLLLTGNNYIGARAPDWLLDKNLSSFPFILGDINNLSLSALLAKKLAVEGIETNPSALFYFMPYLTEVYPLAKIRFISMGGEYVSAERYKFFRQHFKNAYFDFRYGGAENQVLKGIRCEFLASKQPRFFHPTTDYYYFEVVDPQTGEPVLEGEEGELVETSREISPFPLIRYRTGDIVCLTSYTCPCGRKGMLEVLGRARYDHLRLYGVTIYTEAIEKAIANIKELDPFSYQLHVYEVIDDNRLKPKLVLEVLTHSTRFARSGQARSLNSGQELAKRIAEKLFLSSNLTLSDLVKQEIFLPLEIELLDQWPEGKKHIKIVPHFD